MGIDFDHDGHITPLGNPADALAGTARYLEVRGLYRRGETWGISPALECTATASGSSVTLTQLCSMATALSSCRQRSMCSAGDRRQRGARPPGRAGRQVDPGSRTVGANATHVSCAKPGARACPLPPTEILQASTGRRSRCAYRGKYHPFSFCRTQRHAHAKDARACSTGRPPPPDRYVDRSQSFPTAGLRIDVSTFLITSGEGQTYNEQEANAWLGQTCWRKLESRPLAGPSSLILAEAI